VDPQVITIWLSTIINGISMALDTWFQNSPIFLLFIPLK
jgi:hypothetical protein